MQSFDFSQKSEQLPSFVHFCQLWFHKKTALIPKLLYVNYTCFLVFSVGFAFIIKSLVDGLSTTGGNGAFAVLDKFTNQSNLLVWLLSCCLVFFPNHVFFKHNQWVMATFVYILFTFVGYNFILAPFNSQYGYQGAAVSVVSNLWVHLIDPLVFCAWSLYYLYVYYTKTTKRFWNYYGKGLIYPTIYCLYLITIPFVYNDPNQMDFVYSVYGNTTNVKQFATAWIYIGVIYCVYFPVTYLAIYWFAKKLCFKWHQNRRQKVGNN